MKEQDRKIPNPPEPAPPRVLYQDVKPTLAATILLAVLIVTFLGCIAYIFSTITPIVNEGC